MAPRIHLLRHGSIQGNEIRRFIGQSDVNLDANGRRQAAWWRERFGPDRFARIFASDLSRTMDTAGVVAGGRDVEPVPELREIRLGDWEGLRTDVVREREPEAFAARGRDIADYRTPGGESFRDVLDRAWPAFERIAAKARDDVLVVSHAGTIRTLLCRILGVPLSNLFRLRLGYAGLSIVVLQDEYCVELLNMRPPACF